MANSLTTKKVTDLPESTEPADDDLFLAGSGGSASLIRYKWLDIWNKILASIRSKIIVNNLITTVAGYALDAQQGKRLKDQIDEQNTKIDNYIKFVSVTLNEISLQANYDGIFYNGIPSYSGYTPYVVIPSNSNASDVCWMAAFVNSTTEICVKFKNTSPSAKAFKPIVDVIYVKNL